jgi:hypothetical protein
MTQNNMTPKNVGYAYLNNFFMNHWCCKMRANSLFLGGIAGETLKWRLHPLIHTIALKELAQNVVRAPEGEKCGLKYDMWTLRKL